MTNSPAVTPTKPPEKWGTLSAMFYAGLKGQAIAVHLQNGETLTGVLAGVDKYDLCLERPDRSTMLVTKHAIAWLEPYTAAKA